MTTFANIQIKEVLNLRGNTARNLAFTGVPGQITIDTDLNTIRVQDGITPGGNPLASQAYVSAYVANAALGGVDTSGFATTANLNSLSSNVASYQVWANAHFGTSTYGNANVAAYLAGNVNLVNFGQHNSTLGAPAAGGATDRIRLWDFYNTNPSHYNYAIGAEGDHVWFSTDVVSDDGGFKFYSQANLAMKIGGLGTITLGANSAGIFWNNGAAYSSNRLTNGSYNFTLGSGGQLQLPVTGVIGDTYSDGRGASIAAGPASNSYAGINNYSGDQWIEADNTAVYIGTNYLAGGGNVWTFDKSGHITFPDSTVQTTAWSGVSIGTSAPSSPTGSVWYDLNDGRLYANIGGAWVDASPTVAPLASYYLGNLTVDGEVINFTNGNLSIDDSGTLLINGTGLNLVPTDVYNSTGPATIGSGGHYWTFNTVGNLVMPTGAYINYANGTSILSGIGGTYSNVNVAAFIGNTINTGNIIGNNTDPNVYVETSLGGTISTWTFGTNGVFTLPANSAVIQGAGTDSNVNIVASDGTTTATWHFDKQGNLTLPSGGTIKEGTVTVGGNTASTITLIPHGGSDVNQQLLVYPTIGSGEGNHLHLTSGNLAVTSIFLGDDNQYVRTNAGNIVIGTGDSTPDVPGVGYRWQFGNDGNLTVPPYGYISTVALMGSQLTLKAPPSGPVVVRNDGGYNNINVQDQNITVTTSPDSGSTSKTWTFGTDGNLTLPGGNNTLMSGYPGAGFDANTATLVGAQSYVANRDGSRYIGINGDNNAEIGIAGNAWVFSSDSSIRFPDYTVQRTAYELRGLPPLTAWGTAYPTGGESTLDYQFYFDGSSGFPSMVSYSSAGGYPVYNTIWSAESLTSGAPAYSTNGPYNVVNTDQTTILGATLQPGEYVIARIQNLTTGKVFRVTFMGSFNVGDEGNEHKYGSIIVERLL